MAKKKAKPSASDQPPKTEPTAASERTSEPAPQHTFPASDLPQTDGANSSTTDQRAPASSSIRWSGSWRGKASAVAEVAKDSISAAASNASERLPADSAASASANRLSERLRTPRKSSATTQVTLGELDSSVGKGCADGTEELEKDRVKEGEGKEKPNEAEKIPSRTGDTSTEETQEPKERPLPAAGWKGWWSRPAGADGEKHNFIANTDREEAKDTAKDKSKDVGSPDTATLQPSEAEELPVPKDQTSENGSAKSERSTAETNQERPVEKDSESGKAAQRASWFGLWDSGQSIASTGVPSQKAQSVEPTPTASNVASDGFSALDEDKSPPSDVPTKPESKQEQARRSGTWAFWSREPAKAEVSKHKKTDSEGESGELAIARTNTESNPKPAKMSEPEASKSGQSTPAEPEQQLSKQYKKEARSGKSKRREPSLADSILKTTPRAPSEDSGKSADNSDEKSMKGVVKKHLPQNLILPGVANTLPFEETKTYLQSIWGAFRRGPAEAPRHLTLTRCPPKIKKAVAIGVHGYFPIPLLQKGEHLQFAKPSLLSQQHLLTSPSPRTPYRYLS